MGGSRLHNYLTLLGLDESFSEEELEKSYRSLALLNHPDRAGEDSHLRMVIINEAHHFLLEYRKKTVPSENHRKSDPVFCSYRQSEKDLNDAYEQYYSKSIDKENLKKVLLGLKNQFADIVREHPSSDYYLDSIDKICSINKWFD